VRHLGASTSDYKPILLDTYIDNCKLNRPFRFEAMWTKDESSVEVIEELGISMWKALRVSSWLRRLKGLQMI
jgi:hypothetical protein